MKKALIVALMIGLLVPMVSAQQLIGGRGSGMGGTGVAASHDIEAAYYNPACLMRDHNIGGELKIAAGASYTDTGVLSNALSKASDPAQFMLDNFNTNLTFNGAMSGIVGLNIRKVGISVVPIINTVNVNKPAGSLVGSVTASGLVIPALTLGTTYTVPFLPAALDIGLNIKQYNPVYGNIVTAGTFTNVTGTQTTATGGSGMGYDLGLLTSFDVPYVTKLAVGLVMRDIAGSYTRKDTTQKAYIDQGTSQVTFDAAVILPDKNFTVDSSTALGAYATIPGIGLGVALDYEMTKTDSNTHIGLEYPMFLNRLILRAGTANGPNLAKTTIGAELDLVFLKLAINSASDAKNSALTNTYADITIGF